MKEITVISGKGGTGKTSVTAALAAAGKEMVLCDADVDAADLHLLLQPVTRESHVFEGSWIPRIDPGACSRCGICTEYCRFDAISLNDREQYEVDPFKCEGCRLCERICPDGAIASERSTNNSWFISDTRFGTMVHARMGPGEENSGKLVTEVRRTAREKASGQGARYLLTDGPPGTGCPAIASITGTDAVVVVIEPSVTSLHDARRVIELARGFNLPVFALINKWDINEKMALEIEAYLSEESIPLLGKIPFDKAFVEAMIEGLTLPEFAPSSRTTGILHSVWTALQK
jgi:MinD superfamily P-loop ATPase